MNFFGNNCGGGDFDNCGSGISPCLLLILLLLCKGGCGCNLNIDCCTILWIIVLMSVCGGNRSCQENNC